MSEDLRYYFFDHEADGEPSIPAEEGWKNMQQLLDKEMPASPERNPRRYLFFFVAFVSGIVFLTTSYPLKNYFEQTAKTSVAKHDAVVTANENNVAKKQNEEINADANTNATVQQSSSEKSSFERNSSNRLLTQQYSLSKKNNRLDQGATKEVITNELSASEKADNENAVTFNSGHDDINDDVSKNKQTLTDTLNTSTQTLSIVSTGKKEETTKTASAKKNKKTTGKNFHPYWNVNAGLGMNFSLSNTFRSFHPYPFAEVRYNFSPRFFAGASVALLSPVGSKANGVKKTVYVNDTSFDVSRYNEKLNYTSLTYADAALTTGFKLNKKLSVQGGVQFSKLLYTKTTTTLEPFDFNSNILTVQDTDIRALPPTPSAAPVYNNRIDVQKFDIRYIAGINYDLKKISLGLQYQGGFNPVLKGDIVSGDKNKLVTLKVAYRFK